MLDAAIAAISMSLVLLIIAFLLSFVPDKGPTPCRLDQEVGSMRCSSIKYFFIDPFMEVHRNRPFVHADMRVTPDPVRIKWNLVF
jgi:hypothetical protein